MRRCRWTVDFGQRRSGHSVPVKWKEVLVTFAQVGEQHVVPSWFRVNGSVNDTFDSLPPGPVRNHHPSSACGLAPRQWNKHDERPFDYTGIQASFPRRLGNRYKAI